MRKAFSYARFSTAEQKKGFSLARQLEATQAYCDRHGLTLDERTYLDEGVSAFHGSNSSGGDLSVFIELVKDGRIPKGSVLIVENTDRVSRLPVSQAVQIFTDIIKAGLDIVTLAPEHLYTAANLNDLQTWLPLQIACCLAHEESKKKSGRLKDAWQRKRTNLATLTKVSKKGPFWLKLTKDRQTWIVLEEKADLMRQMIQWTIDGLGASRIVEKLNEIDPDGLTGKGWERANILKLLRSRAVIGEFQPFTGTCAKKGGVKSTRMPFGQPIKGYFPTIVSDADYYRAQEAMTGRKKGGGRMTGTPNLFNGYLYDATGVVAKNEKTGSVIDGRRMVLNMDNGHRVLVSSGALRKLPGSVFRSMHYDRFEAAILSQLRELTPAMVLGKANRHENEVEALSGRLTALNHNINQTQQRAAKADDPTVFLDLLEDYGKQRKETIAAWEKAKAKTANQASDDLGECVSLIALMDGTDNGEREQLRLRMKAALRRLVDQIWVLIVPRGPTARGSAQSAKGRNDRLVAVQVHFRTGARRDYLIHFDREGGWQVRSLTREERVERGFPPLLGNGSWRDGGPMDGDEGEIAPGSVHVQSVRDWLERTDLEQLFPK